MSQQMETASGKTTARSGIPSGSFADAPRTTTRGRSLYCGGSGGRTSAPPVITPSPAERMAALKNSVACAVSAELRGVGAADAGGPCGSGGGGPPESHVKSAKPPINTRNGANRESRERGGRVASLIQVASSTVSPRAGDSADAQWPVRPQRQRCSPDASRDLHIPPR